MLGLFRRGAAKDAPGASDAAGAAPDTYAQWSACLDTLAQGLQDEDCLERMARGRLDWTAGVAPLFTQRLADELQRRLGRCADRLTRDLRAGTSEVQVVQAVLQARTQLFFLHRLCQLPALPVTVRSQLHDEVRRFAARSQQSLLDSARADRSGRLASVLNHNPLTRYDELVHAASQAGAHAPAPASAPPATGETTTRRRHILS